MPSPGGAAYLAALSHVLTGGAIAMAGASVALAARPDLWDTAGPWGSPLVALFLALLVPAYLLVCIGAAVVPAD